MLSCVSYFFFRNYWKYKRTANATALSCCLYNAPLLCATPWFVRCTRKNKLVHLLWIGERIEFKILTLTYKVIHGVAPSFLQYLLERYCPTRTLRSQDDILLVTRKRRLQSFGARGHFHVQPQLSGTSSPALSDYSYIN